jgi:hypothetical protein
MKKALCILSILAVATVASADVQIFFTNGASPFAGSGPTSVFAPTAGNSLDYSADGYVPNYAIFPAGTGNPIVQLGETAYVWVKFTTTNGLPTVGAKMQGLDLQLQKGGVNYTLGAGDDIAYYVQDDSFGTGNKRWDGDFGPGNINFKQAHQVLVGVTATGIRNLGADAGANLYQGSTKTALLGAIKLNSLGTYSYTLGSLGISFNTGGTPAVQFGTLTVVPEPAALVLLAVAGLLIRRR